jgi:hypothetical protein
MDRSILIQIFKQIVIDMSYDKDLQINSFAVVDDMIDLNHSSFGKTYEDYLDGFFFSRSWVNGGADANEIKGEFPLLFVEQRSLSMDRIDSDSLTLPFYFVVVDKISCDACPPGLTRTSEDTLRNTLAMLRIFFKELLNYKNYTYTIPGPEKKSSWTTEGRLDYLIGEGDVLSRSGFSEDLESLLPDPARIQVSQWGNFKDLRAHATEISFTVCDPATGSFSYENATVEDLGRTLCKTC